MYFGLAAIMAASRAGVCSRCEFPDSAGVVGTVFRHQCQQVVKQLSVAVRGFFRTRLSAHRSQEFFIADVLIVPKALKQVFTRQQGGQG